MMTRILTGVVIGGLALTMWWSLHPSGEIPLELMGGWFTYLLRVRGQVHVRWDGIAQFVIASSLALLLLHVLTRWFARETSRGLGRPLVQWRWRWSFMLLAATGLMFIAGIAMIGVVHQSIWMLRSPQPLFSQQERDTDNDSLVGDYRRLTPPYRSYAKRLPPEDYAPGPETDTNWLVKLLPWIMYQIPPQGPESSFGNPAADPFFKSLVPEVINPQFVGAPIRDRSGYGLTHVAGNMWIFDGRGRRPFYGATNFDTLLMFGEVNSGLTPWGHLDINRDPRQGLNNPQTAATGFGSTATSDSVLFALANGAVREVADNIDARTLEQMSVPKRGAEF